MALGRSVRKRDAKPGAARVCELGLLQINEIFEKVTDEELAKLGSKSCHSVSLRAVARIFWRRACSGSLRQPNSASGGRWCAHLRLMAAHESGLRRRSRTCFSRSQLNAAVDRRIKPGCRT